MHRRIKYGLGGQGLPFSDVTLGLSMLLFLLGSKARDSCLSIAPDGVHVLLVHISAIAQNGGDRLSFPCWHGSPDPALVLLAYVCPLLISREPTKEIQVVGSGTNLKQDLFLCHIVLLGLSSGAPSRCICFQYQVGGHALRVCQNLKGDSWVTPGGRGENIPGVILPKGPWRNKDKYHANDNGVTCLLIANMGRSSQDWQGHLSLAKLCPGSLWETNIGHLTLERES